jgi:hypothetical protein
MPMTRRGIPAMFLALARVLLPVQAQAGEPTKQECVSANETAQDLRRVAQLRQARAELARCVSASCPGPVREDCAQQLVEVDSAMPTLVLVAKDKAGNDLSAVLVTMDGLPFADSLDGTAIQVDPGEHRFVFEGEGLPPAEKVVVVREGDKNRHVSVVLQPLANDLLAQQPPSGPLLSGPTQRAIAVALGGAGTVSLVIGSVFGLVAKSTYDDAYSNDCSHVAPTCRAEGAHGVQTAYDQATASTFAFVAGAMLLGGGAYLYFASPKMGHVAVGPTAGARGVGLRVSAVW